MIKKTTPLEWKIIFDSNEFEEKYGYEGNDLGVMVSEEKTVFKLWAPTAREVTLNLYYTGSDEEEGAGLIAAYTMIRTEKGIWRLECARNLTGVYYTYSVNVEGEIKETADPYGKACGVNGKRSMVLDLTLTNPIGWEEDRRPLIEEKDRVIYEVHVKDFSSDEHSGICEEYRGKYLAFTEKNSTLDNDGIHLTCISYLKQLGVTYVHLLPVFDFGSVDESKSSADQFNWGYDPENYNVPEGSYATDPWHGEVRIREFKEMVKALHEEGIGVVMDVVYNHTYHMNSCFQYTVPYYYYRLWENGEISDGSVCGNDTASDRRMYRKYMIDSVCYWAEEYHLDGFRFDLMGLHDTETMNEIRGALNKLPGGERILMYGEPWAGGQSAMKKEYDPAVKANIHLLDENISIFCDSTRDCIKGSVFKERIPGYVNGRPELAEDILRSVAAWCVPESGFKPKAPKQIIGYVSAHDNYTLWDKLLLSTREEPDFTARDEEIIQMNKMAAGIVFTCRGIPFFQAGEEFGRTKQGIGDSYKTPSSINQLDWRRAYEYSDLVEYYRFLIKLRKEYYAFGTYVWQDDAFAISVMQMGNVTGYVMNYPADETKEAGRLAVFYNPECENIEVNLLQGSWQLISDGVKIDNGERKEGTVNLLPKSVTILKSRF